MGTAPFSFLRNFSLHLGIQVVSSTVTTWRCFFYLYRRTSGQKDKTSEKETPIGKFLGWDMREWGLFICQIWVIWEATSVPDLTFPRKCCLWHRYICYWNILWQSAKDWRGMGRGFGWTLKTWRQSFSVPNGTTLSNRFTLWTYFLFYKTGNTCLVQPTKLLGKLNKTIYVSSS